MKGMIISSLLIISMMFTGCSSTNESNSKYSFSDKEIKIMINDGNAVTDNYDSFMDKYENKEDYSNENEENKELTDKAIENILEVEKNNKEKLTQEEQNMLDDLLSKYKYIKQNFEFNQKTYDMSCDIVGIILELEGE